MLSKAIAAVIPLMLGALTACAPSTHTVYVTQPTNNNVAAYRINNHSGAFTTIVGSPYLSGNSPGPIVVDPAGKHAYVANRIDNTISLYRIDSLIGSLSEVMPRTTTACSGYGYERSGQSSIRKQ